MRVWGAAHPCQQLLYQSLIVVILVGMELCLLVVLIYICLMTDVEHFFHVFISHLFILFVKCPSLGCFFILICLSSLRI